MFKNIFVLLFVCLVNPLTSYAFDGSQYSQSGEDLCLFIRNYYGGLNPYSMQCAMGAGAGEFTTHESSFCHKIILEGRMSAGTCLKAILSENSDAKLDACELKTAEQEILLCLQQ